MVQCASMHAKSLKIARDAKETPALTS